MTTRRLWLALASTMAMAAASPGGAVPTTPAPVAAPSFEQALGAAATLLDAGQVEPALAALEALRPRAELPIEEGQIESLRSFALARLNRIPEARKAIEAGIARAPAPSMLLLRQLFLLRTFDGDPKGAAETLQLIAAGQPAGLQELPTEVVSGVLEAIRSDDNLAFNTDFSLVSAGWAPADLTIGAVDEVRLRLMRALMKRERVDDARTVLAGVLNPVILVRAGIDRRFEPLWPEIETRLGPGADIADAAFVAATKARFDKTPDSLVARLGYAEALNIASREPEALVVADAVKTPAELAALNDRELWLVNLHAALLADAGRIDEALARYAAVNATPLEGRPALVGTMINAALLAESVDRPAVAIALADAIDARGPLINDYVRLYTAQVRACALQQQGKGAEATAAAAPLVAKPDANDGAYLAAMLCLQQSDAAAAAVIRRLGSDDDRTEMLFELQPFLIAERDRLADKRARAALRALKARADVKAAFLKAGRDMPARVAPPR